MRKRSLLLVFAALVSWAGCIDTAEPTGPVPTPPPEEGELAPDTDADAAASVGRRAPR